MKKFIVVFILGLVFFKGNRIDAQSSFKLQSGYSYMEHFSIGMGWTIRNKHSISVLYGSDFFIKPQDFSSYLIQYELCLNKLQFGRFTPKIGIKGGYSVYTNQYYRWELMALIPSIGFIYSVNKRLDLSMESGIAFSRDITMKRLSFGEIGWYKKTLPEIKIVVLYNLRKEK